MLHFRLPLYTRNGQDGEPSCCGFWLWSWLAAVVNLFVLNLLCFISVCLYPKRADCRTHTYREETKKGKRHNRVHPGHFATQQGTPFYPAGMSAADWSTIVFTLPRGKMAWVHPTMATFFQNCTLILDKYPVVSENETLPPAISLAEITLRSR